MNPALKDVSMKINSQSAKKLGLDDPKRVYQIRDRGQAFLPAHNDGAVTTTGTTTIEDIERELDDAHVPCALDKQRKFIPHGALARILTLQRVRDIVHSLQCFQSSSEKDRIAEEIYYGSKQPPCLKLLAALIGMEKSNDIAKLMQDGVNDSCFPLKHGGLDSNRTVTCNNGDEHQFLGKKRKQYREDLSRWSYSLSAPFITRKGRIHHHYVLEPGDVFPIISADDTHSGGFSQVQKIRFHDSHFDFGTYGIRHPECFFALKMLNSSDGSRESFNMELSSLLFSEDKAPGTQKHLIQVLATFEVVDGESGKSTWYFLFDWAEGNLADFWKRNDELVRNPEHLLWMAEQFHGMSLALRCVHNERLAMIPSFDLQKNPDSKKLYGRHGDISSANFLWFLSNQFPGLLTLADFGLGRLHSEVSRSAQNPRDLARTATYRAPEFDLDKPLISRKADIFSLGCVFFEHIIWYFRGSEGLEQCANDRTEPDVFDFDADTFFTFPKGPTGAKRRPVLKKKVRQLFEEFQNDPACSLYLSELLDIIRDNMLEPDHTKRIDSGRLQKKMQTLLKACETDPEYYTHRTSSSDSAEETPKENGTSRPNGTSKTNGKAPMNGNTKPRDHRKR